MDRRHSRRRELPDSHALRVPGRPCGVLYQALRAQACCFSEAQLDQFDHLFCGTHLDWVASRLPQTLRTLLLQSHELVQQDYRSLRGIWRWQEEFFRAMSADL